MPHSNIHNKKRRKNYITLAIILVWCVIIYTMSMVKMAHSHGIPDRYKTDREAHQVTIEKQWEEFDEQGATHQKEIEAQGESWWYGEHMSDQAKEMKMLKEGKQFEWESDGDYQKRISQSPTESTETYEEGNDE